MGLMHEVESVERITSVVELYQYIQYTSLQARLALGGTSDEVGEKQKPQERAEFVPSPF